MHIIVQIRLNANSKRKIPIPTLYLNRLLFKLWKFSETSLYLSINPLNIFNLLRFQVKHYAYFVVILFSEPYFT